MKTPDVIKKGLECLFRHRMDDCDLECSKCDVYAPGWTTSGLCADALTYIQQLEAKDAEKDKRIADLERELAAVKRERDALVDGLHGICESCKHYETELCACCLHDPDTWNATEDNWEWRGVCPENTGVQVDGQTV